MAELTCKIKEYEAMMHARLDDTSLDVTIDDVKDVIHDNRIVSMYGDESSQSQTTHQDVLVADKIDEHDTYTGKCIV